MPIKTFKSIPIESLGSGGDLEVSEIISHTEVDEQLHYQKLDPWVKNVCGKIKRGVFDPAKLVPAIEKYATPCAIDRYTGTAGSSKEWRKATKRVISARLSRQIIDTARKHLASGKKCSVYESRQAKKYVDGGHKGHPPYC